MQLTQPIPNTQQLFEKVTAHWLPRLQCDLMGEFRQAFLKPPPHGVSVLFSDDETNTHIANVCFTGKVELGFVASS